MFLFLFLEWGGGEGGRIFKEKIEKKFRLQVTHRRVKHFCVNKCTMLISKKSCLVMSIRGFALFNKNLDMKKKNKLYFQNFSKKTLCNKFTNFCLT